MLNSHDAEMNTRAQKSKYSQNMDSEEPEYSLAKDPLSVGTEKRTDLGEN